VKSMDAPQTLFGLPYRLGGRQAESVALDLEKRFEVQHGRAPDTIESDLEAMRSTVFNPVSREAKIRDTLDEWRPELSFDPPYPEAQIVEDVGDGAWAITPEGRVAISILNKHVRQLALSKSDGPEPIDEWNIAAAEHLLRVTYREWSSYRLTRVVKLREGLERPMLPVALGTILFLLINGNIGSDQALSQPKSDDDQQALDDAITKPILAFSAAFDEARQSRRRDQHVRLYNGYALSEARRRLGDVIRLERSGEGPGKGARSVYISSEGREKAVAALAREISARELPRDRVEFALDSFISAYQETQPALAAFAISNGRPSTSRDIRNEILERLGS